MRALVNTANPDQSVEIRDVPEPSPAPNEAVVEPSLPLSICRRPPSSSNRIIPPSGSPLKS